MRVEVVETSSQVWKTCILTAVLHSQIGLGIIIAWFGVLGRGFSAIRGIGVLVVRLRGRTKGANHLGAA